MLAGHGHDAIHTSVLPDGNRSTDAQVAHAADRDQRVIVSKDSDFRDSHLISGTPKQLLVVATGNITNNELLTLFDRYLEVIVESLARVAACSRTTGASHTTNPRVVTARSVLRVPSD